MDRAGTTNRHHRSGASGSGDADSGTFDNSNEAAPPPPGDAGKQSTEPKVLASMRIEPKDATLEVDAGSVGKLKYKVLGQARG